MAQVTIQVGDRAHTVACADGGEARVETLGAMLSERWPAARRAAGAAGAEREMLLIALMLADKLDETLNAPPPEVIADDKTLAALADRLETLADALEADAPNA
jgi:cell division protein ZapA